jgi:electron transfer flavoprotein beta subunit
MKIAVCLKQVPVRDWPPQIEPLHPGIYDQDATWELNEPDAYALEEALRLRERYGGEVVACSAGPARVTQVLREALARGVDRAIHASHSSLAWSDAFVTAGALADALRPEAFDLVLTGLQSDDQGFAQTGVVLAGRLERPHATIVMDIQVDRGRLRVKRELEGGWFQWVGMSLPAVVTVQSGINQLRYATLKGIMAAKKKEIRVVAVNPAASRHRVVSLAVPGRTRHAHVITGSPQEAARELVRALREDARVLP